MPAPDSAIDSRSVHPLTIHHNGRMGGPYILYAESAQIRAEWKQKLEEALGLRKIVQESNKVFEVETLSADTFLVPSMSAAAQGPAWNQESTYTGKVTCSVPFSKQTGAGNESLFNLTYRYTRWAGAGRNWMCRGCLDWIQTRSQVYVYFIYVSYRWYLLMIHQLCVASFILKWSPNVLCSRNLGSSWYWLTR